MQLWYRPHVRRHLFYRSTWISPCWLLHTGSTHIHIIPTASCSDNATASILKPPPLGFGAWQRRCMPCPLSSRYACITRVRTPPFFHAKDAGLLAWIPCRPHIPVFSGHSYVVVSGMGGSAGRNRKTKHEKPTVNVSCATKWRPDYPDLPRL